MSNQKKTKIIQTLKNTYNRNLRKQVVKTILEQEHEQDKADDKIIEQIFLFVLKELDWKVPENPKDWDYTPLHIMEEAFPNIQKTKWFQVQVRTAEKLIEMEMNK
jgi:hypothetical protein